MSREPFLRDYQEAAMGKMNNGCILNGGTGSGKSRTALYYYFTQNGGYIGPAGYFPMNNPKSLYIITTAMKRDSLEWEGELTNLILSTDSTKNDLNENVQIIIDSWNNIKKYAEVKDSFFIFDEDRVTGSGVWVKSFIKIANSNEWIILSATPGDKWEDYIPVFIANGFYKNKTEFSREHLIYSRYCTSFPKVEGYMNTGRLIRLRRKILVDMDFNRSTEQHHMQVNVDYDIPAYKAVIKDRWDPYKQEPIEQASGLCYVLRKVVNSDPSRINALLNLLNKHDRVIIFYNFDYELEVLRESLTQIEDLEVAEWNGHMHQPVPDGRKWAYLVQYTAGCEGWNCIKTDTIIFYSQNYSYKVVAQATGRIDRMNTPYKDLYYYHFKSKSGIDLAISKALAAKKKFNETSWVNGSR